MLHRGNFNIALRDGGRHAGVTNSTRIRSNFFGRIDVNPTKHDAMIGWRRPQTKTHRHAAMQANTLCAYRLSESSLSEQVQAPVVIDLQLGQYRFGAANLELAGGFNRHMLDDTVIDNHRVAIGTDAHAACRQVQRQVHGL